MAALAVTSIVLAPDTNRRAISASIGQTANTLVPGSTHHAPAPLLTNSVGQTANTLVPGSTYHALAPVRIIDSSTGAAGAVPLASETPESFQMTGAFGIPDRATAVVGTLSIARPSHAGFVALTAVSTSPTSVATSTLHVTANESSSAGVTATLGADGKLWALYEAGEKGQTSQLSFDLDGYYAPDDRGSTYHVLAPDRIFDSRRIDSGARSLTSDVPASFGVAGAFGVPVGATSVTGTLTILNASGPGRVALTPESTPATSLRTSTISLATTDPGSTGVTATLGADGRLWAIYETGRPDDSADLIFDLTGYFTPDMTGSTFHPLGPLRLIDSSSGVGDAAPLLSETPGSIGIVGRYGIPSATRAVTGTLTVANPTHAGYVALTPDRTSLSDFPSASLQLVATRTGATGVSAALGADGGLWAAFETGRPGDKADVIFDLSGYFAHDGGGLKPVPAYFWDPGSFVSFPRDSQGVIQVQYDPPTGLQYNPVTISQGAISFFNRWHSGKNSPAEATADRTAFFAQANWLVANQQPDGRWLYQFPLGTQPVPWWSALAEGQGMSVMVRAYSVTGDSTYRTALDRARSTFDRTIAELGVDSSVSVSGKDLTVYQEYLPGFYDTVLNGWIFALVGLYEDAIYIGDPIAVYDLVAADRGLPALRVLLPSYDTGSWSNYGLDPVAGAAMGFKASSFYQGLHVQQLRFLYSITGDPAMKKYADRFQSYLSAEQTAPPSGSS